MTRGKAGCAAFAAVLLAAVSTSQRAVAPPANGDLVANASAKLSSTPASFARLSSCPADMLEVDGDYYNYVEQYCASYPDAASIARDRCFEFHPTGRTFGAPTHVHMCIDRYEWPNKAGTKPIIAVDWDYAKAHCEAIGKRLCYEKEWTVACEGQERLPYPYGYRRDPDACNIDKPYIVPDNFAFKNESTRAAEIARVDQREPSGFRESCVSPYGVHDMTGNVDEWVIYPEGKILEKPYRSGLKGGYWGPVRNRCRPTTTDHSQWHFGYQIGFRCCVDAAPRARAAPSEASRAGG